MEGDEDYVATKDSTDGRRNWSKNLFDDAGRVYQVNSYPSEEDTNYFEINSYYDRNNRLVSTGDLYSVHTEYAYDGAGRLYQVRQVEDAPVTPFYSTEVFSYKAPAPHPALSSMSTTGDAGLIHFTHTVYDDGGNVTENHTFEKNHNDYNGIDIDATTSYIRRTVFSWYDDADRLTATADYGSGDGTSASTTWKYTAVATRAATAPTWTASQVYQGEVLLTEYAYEAASGRQNLVTIGVEEGTSDTITMAAKTFFDDLGRRTYVAENYVDFVDAATPTGIGGGTNDDEDRATGWTYNGLGQTLTLTAYNKSSSTADQVTTYEYEDNNSVDASLVTKTIYPDGDASSDNVQVTYNLDGSQATMTDQRAVVHTFSYDDARRLELDGATTIPVSVDDHIKSIGRTYDSMGRMTHITSYSANDGSGTVRNEVKLTIDSLGKVTKSEQSHELAVGGSTPAIEYAYDTSVSGGSIYCDALRLENYTYPDSRKIHYDYDMKKVVTERQNRIYRIKKDNGGLPGSSIVDYYYNGMDRFVESEAGILRLDATTSSYNYDSWDRFGRTVRQWWKRRTSTRAKVSHTYDYAGNRLTRQVEASTNDNWDQKYTYDGLMRLSQGNSGTLDGNEDITDANAKFRQKWSLDQLGNWSDLQQDGVYSDLTTLANNNFTDSTDLDQDRTHNDANELTAFTEVGGQPVWIDPVLDAAGNMTTMPQPKDPTKKFDLKYDAWNRVVEIKNDVGTVVTANEYDGLNRRIIRDESGGSGDVRHFYYNNQWQVLEETVESGGSETVESQYVYHPYYVDAVLVRYDASSTEHFYLHDANFNVIGIANSSKNIIERYSYTPYGEVVVLDADYSADTDNKSDIDNELLYTGRRLDPESGLQLNRNRFYVAGLGRWVNRDPIGYDGGTLNLYEYVNGMPIIGIDAYGKQAGWPQGEQPKCNAENLGNVYIIKRTRTCWKWCIEDCIGIYYPCRVTDTYTQTCTCTKSLISSPGHQLHRMFLHEWICKNSDGGGCE